MSEDIFVVIEHLQGQVADITFMMLAAARVLADGTGGDVVGMLLGHNAEDLSNSMAADRVLYQDHPALAEFTSDAYLASVAELIEQNNPRAVFFGHTSIGMDLAATLSIRLGLPLVSQVSSVSIEAEGPTFTSQICGGKIMAEGTLPGPTALLSMIPGSYKPEEGQSEQSPEVIKTSTPPLDNLRVKLSTYIQPEAEDVDVTKEPILVAVGRGVQTEDNIELAEELAEILGGVVCSSRPIVDQGWLPISRMIGKSGQIVKPKLYLALGISGAPEHVEGMAESATIIAINTDPTAPIFDVAKYGSEVDLLDLTEVLIEKLQ